VVNQSSFSIDLTRLRVRFWFTADGNALSGLTFASTFGLLNGMTTIPPADVVGTLAPAPIVNVTATSDSYVEVSYTSAAGALVSGGKIEGNCDLSTPGFVTTLNDQNDYSYFGGYTASAYVPTQTITAYLDGQLVWGCEP
jgi:hypothetical protein